MADFTYPPGTVLDESTGEFSVGSTGVLRNANGDAVDIFDLNDSPIPSIRVGARGVHEAFKANVPDGLLDFGSTLMPVVSQESHRAGLQAIQVAEAAVESAQSAETAASDAANSARDAATKAEQAASLVVASPRFVIHGDDESHPRPEEQVLPVIWVGSVLPVHADPARDTWLQSSTLAAD